MPVEIWLGKQFETTHERRAFQKIIDDVKQEYGNRDEMVFILANYLMMGKEIDLTIIKENAIIIVELKNFSEPFVASENGVWRAKNSSGFVKSGDENPFIQIKKYRMAWMDFLEKNKREIFGDRDVPPYIQGLVCIDPRIPVGVENHILPLPWFGLIGANALVKEIDLITNRLEIKKDEIRRIIRLENLSPAKDVILRDNFIVPFGRNPSFTGRIEELENLHGLMKETASRNNNHVIISGMGGIGKTQLVIEYAYRHREMYPDGIYWVNASENDWISAFSSLAEKVGVSIDEGGEETRKLRRARSILEKIERNKDVLLIFDNIKNVSRLTEPIDNFVPSKFKCHILGTSITKDTLLPFIFYSIPAIDIQSAMRMLLKRVDHHDVLNRYLSGNYGPDVRDAEEICNQFGCLPLALAISSAYLAKYKTIDLRGYLKRLEIEGGLIVERFPITPNHMETRHNINVSSAFETQWKSITLEDSKRFLMLASLMEENAIESLDRLCLFLGWEKQLKPGYPSIIEEVLTELDELSLIEKLPGDQVRVHPLIRKFIKEHYVKEPEYLALDCIFNTKNHYIDPSNLDYKIRYKGAFPIIQDLSVAKSLSIYLSSVIPEIIYLQELTHILNLFEPDLLNIDKETDSPNNLQQIRNTGFGLGYFDVIAGIDTYLNDKSKRWFREKIQANKEKGSLDRRLHFFNLKITAIKVLPVDRLIFGTSEGKVKCVDIKSGRFLWELEFPTLGVDEILLSGDEGLIVLVDNGGIQVANNIIDRQDDVQIVIWNLQTNKQICHLTETEDNISRLVRLTNYDTLLVGRKDGDINVIDLFTGNMVGFLKGHKTPVLDVAVEGERIASVSGDGQIIVHALDSLEILTIIPCPIARYAKIEFYGDDRLVCHFSEQSYEDLFNLFKIVFPRPEPQDIDQLLVFNLDDKKVVWKFNVFERLSPTIMEVRELINEFDSDDEGGLMILAGYQKFMVDQAILVVSNDGRYLAFHTPLWYLGVIDFEERRINFFRVGFPVTGLGFSENHLLLSCDIELAGDSINPITIIDLDSFEQKYFQGESEEITVSEVDIEQRKFITSHGGEIKIWDIPAMAAAASEEPQKLITNIFITKDGSKIIGTDEKTISVYDLELNKICGFHSDQSVRVLSLNNNHALIGQGNGFYTFDLSNGAIEEVETTAEFNVHDIFGAAIDDNSFVLLESDVFNFYDVIESKEVICLQNVMAIDGTILFEFTEKHPKLHETINGGLLSVINQENEIVIFDVLNHEELYIVSNNGIEVKDVIISRDGTTLYVLYENENLLVWNLFLKEPFVVFPEIGEISALCCTFDGKTFVFINQSNDILVGDRDEMQIFGSIRGDFSRCIISLDGNILVALDTSGLIHIFNCENLHQIGN